jgi:hypothetical protein
MNHFITTHLHQRSSSIRLCSCQRNYITDKKATSLSFIDRLFLATLFLFPGAVSQAFKLLIKLEGEHEK